MRRGIPRRRNANEMPVCYRGHLMTEANTYHRPGSTNNPQCRACRRMMRKVDEYTRPEGP